MISRKTRNLITSFVVCIGFASTTTEAEELIPLATIVDELSGEPNGMNTIYPIASRCAANRLWLGMLSLRSYEETGEPSENQLAAQTATLGRDWLSVANTALSALTPDDSPEELDKTNKKSNCPACLAALVAAFIIQPRRISAIN